MSRKEIASSVDELIQNYLENQASPAEEARFRILLGEEAFRRRVAEHAIELAVLCDRGLADLELSATHYVKSRRRWHALAVATLAASVLLGLVSVWAMLHSNDGSHEIANRPSSADPETTSSAEKNGNVAVVSTDDRPVIGHLESVVGPVFMASGFDLPANPVLETKAKFCSGDMLHTADAESFALLRLHDNSLLAVSGDTELTCSVVDSQKKVVVRGGDVIAKVGRQPHKNPMVFETPVAHAEVLGTTLSLFADSELTEVAVMEGQVRLCQLADNQTVQIREGESAVATKDSDLVKKSIAPASAVWEEDFEKGWPRRWRAGHWVNYGLPEGSTRAVRAQVREDTDGHALIASGNEWSAGLFCIDAESHVNLTYKLNARRWFYLRLDVRSQDFRKTERKSYFFRSPKLWNIPLHQWRTVSLPIRFFYEASDTQDDQTSPASPQPGDVVFALSMRTNKPDPELFVDRIWVTKGPAKGAILLDLSRPKHTPPKAVAGQHAQEE